LTLTKLANAFRNRRGFSSTVVALLAMVFVSAFAAITISQSWHGDSVLASFESRKIANHHANAVEFVNDSLRDAVFDSVYAGGDGSTLAEAYALAAARELGDSKDASGGGSGVETSVSNFRATSANSDLTADEKSVGKFEFGFVVDSRFDLFARRGSAFKNESVSVAHRIIANTSHYPAYPKRFKIDGFEVVVTP
jgi:hypothetical protein